MRKIRGILIFLLVLTGIYFIGPKPDKPVFAPGLPSVPPPLELDTYISGIEGDHKVKGDNEARIVWANDTLKQKTPYAIVYLHGFSASQEEGNPVHREIARKFGCNLYLSRLADHGIDTVDAMYHFTADRLWESAKEALAIGRQLGDTVILMGTSTGGTLALQLAAAFPNEVGGLVLYSPNIAINDPNAWLLNDRWGLTIARMVKKSDYIETHKGDYEYGRYWYPKYCLEAVVQLEELLERTMTKETFEKVTQPTLVLYYYRDERNQDPVVKVSAMKEMFESIRTPAAQKRMIPVPNAGSHVLASPIQSKDIETVKKETGLFMQQVLRISEKDSTTVLQTVF